MKKKRVPDLPAERRVPRQSPREAILERRIRLDELIWQRDSMKWR